MISIVITKDKVESSDAAFILSQWSTWFCIHVHVLYVKYKSQRKCLHGTLVNTLTGLMLVLLVVKATVFLAHLFSAQADLFLKRNDKHLFRQRYSLAVQQKWYMSLTIRGWGRAPERVTNVQSLDSPKNVCTAHLIEQAPVVPLLLPSQGPSGPLRV